MQYPKIMQPTHARWERLPPSDPRVATKLAQGMSTLSLTNGTSEAESAAVGREANEPSDSQPEQPITESTLFSSVPAALSRRFAIHDIQFESSPYSNLGVPGPDGDVHDLGSNGLISVADSANPEFTSPEILEELPPECKEALIEAAAQEWKWKSKWCHEANDGARAKLLKSYAWFP